MSTNQLIKSRLENSIALRNNDKLLVLQIWKDLGLHLTKEQQKVYWDLPADGVITRRRRELRALYPDSKEVQDKRFKLFQEHKEKYSNHSWFKKFLDRVK